MKSFSVVLVLAAAQFASAQLLPHYDRAGGQSLSDGACIQSGFGHSGSGYTDDSYMQAQPVMHADDRAGITTKEMVGNGSGTMVTMQARSNAMTSFGIAAGSYYMMQAGAFVVPLFAQVRQNFFMTRGEGVYGATYGFAAAGPTVGVGENILAPSFSEFFQSLSFRVGAGAMTGVGAELGGNAMGWSVFTEGGLIGMAFTAKLGPHQTYAAPFFAFGLRRAFGN